MDKIFFDGLYSNDVPETLPDFILGKGSIHIDKMTKFLSDNKQYADEKGYLQYTILRSKDAGSRYAVLDTYRYEKAQEVKQQQPETINTTPVQRDFSGTPAPLAKCENCGEIGKTKGDGLHDCIPF